ncbi:hypothetical protein GCM10023194_57110 [Planotetraspora phitsanulokensis]|uniref:Uncharacterized protein n=1 Tax=Planotetraspora phitsanulokensis TaxID=575192 RepID=A0A8J3XNP8_9ACTN|nr:hypothetical protein Pph01_80710 [Planotetraspora phitsanulokensis]
MLAPLAILPPQRGQLLPLPAGQLVPDSSDRAMGMVTSTVSVHRQTGAIRPEPRADRGIHGH